ncbi:hypothetical protein L2Y94_06495 [Luteibacter aegosomatis]|uniref:hypothetical protein n=1 Tax=Luteibacter aegosomatis TaxID=2911537 RepID=UPI001FF96953|nr:hypothetical protein [Luteibacter aegosomatis]UPG87000.1 hypothetical protein L2Y94_06495 [Luteibacter aegosomatis]
MKIFNFFRSLRATPPVADSAVENLRRQLRGKCDSTVLAQAEARLRRRIFQGIEPTRATAAVVAWATQADHASYAGT